MNDRYFTLAEVVAGIDAGDEWYARVDGTLRPIRRVSHCPWPGCSTIPYISARAAFRGDGLEQLPAT